jgi:hypothetical protein
MTQSTTHGIPAGVRDVIGYLNDPVATGIAAPRELYGFGGLHGGLLLARAAATAAGSGVDAPRDASVVSVTGHFHTSVRSPFDVRHETLHAGTVGSVAFTVVNAGTAAVTGTMVTSAVPLGSVTPSPAPTPPPTAGLPRDWPEYRVPVEVVPVSACTEIRPVGPNRPYAGGAEPRLTSWVRIVGDDGPMDTSRFIFLVDALAPALAAVLDEIIPIPTIELAVRPSPGLPEAATPWVLLDARAGDVRADGWHGERIDAWDETGRHLGHARQLRLARAKTIPGP